MCCERYSFIWHGGRQMLPTDSCIQSLNTDTERRMEPCIFVYLKTKYGLVEQHTIDTEMINPRVRALTSSPDDLE